MDRIPTMDDYLKMPVHSLRQTGGVRLVLGQKYDLSQPLVSVITIVKNRKDTLSQTIRSVLCQSYPNIEYIIVDGASTDGTLEIIKQFDDRVALWISEPDSGTSDAFNKAVSMAQGDFIFWLSSDDWIEADFIKTAVPTFLDSGADFVYGNMAMYENKKLVRTYRGDKNYREALMSGYPRFNFVTMLVKRECFQATGLIDTTYKFFSDYEWVLRVHLNGKKGVYNDALIVHRRVGGVGESCSIESVLEHLRLLRKYRLPKLKAMFVYLYYFARRMPGYFIRLFLPDTIYKKLKRQVNGC
jgi:glycosyltransferase involved in cell wall biosynthesis